MRTSFQHCNCDECEDFRLRRGCRNMIMISLIIWAGIIGGVYGLIH